MQPGPLYAPLSQDSLTELAALRSLGIRVPQWPVVLEPPSGDTERLEYIPVLSLPRLIRCLNILIASNGFASFNFTQNLLLDALETHTPKNILDQITQKFPGNRKPKALKLLVTICQHIPESSYSHSIEKLLHLSQQELLGTQ